MKARHVILSLALLASAALAFFGDKEPEGVVVESVERTAPAPSRSPAAPPAAIAAAPERGEAVMRLIPREELIGARGTGEGGAFKTHNWSPPPAETAPLPEQAPPPPMAPPIPFVFIGKTLGEGKWEIHLSQGDRIHTVRSGDVIEGAWRIDAVAPPTMTITYLPMDQVQTMNIGANQ